MNTEGGKAGKIVVFQMLLKTGIKTDLGKSSIHDKHDHKLQSLTCFTPSAFPELSSCPLDATVSALNQDPAQKDWKHHIPSSCCLFFTPFLKTFSSMDQNQKSPLSHKNQHMADFPPLGCRLLWVWCRCGSASLCHRKKWLKAPTSTL